MSDKQTKFLEEYQIVPRHGVAVSQILSKSWEKLGKPTTPLSKNGAKLMDILIATWEDLFPEQRERWLEERKDYQDYELPIRQQVKRHTGRSLASYPSYIYYMMKKLFPNFNSAERKNCFKMVKKWPMFRFANKV